MASGAASSRPRYWSSTWVRFFSAALRTLMLRMAAVTRRTPSALVSGLSMISMGKSVPSLRRPDNSMPVPISWASASVSLRVASVTSRSAKPSGMMLVTRWPSSSSRR